MGILRILLAISVLIAHTTPIAGSRFLLGPLAVQTFYMLSGFYMALILEEKYKKLPVRLFYTNRFLRIFPTYWVVLFLSIAFSLITFARNGNPTLLRSYAIFGSTMDIFPWIYLLLSNLFIFGQDIVMFMGLNPQSHSLFFTSNFWQTSPGLYTFLLVPQAWTISLELMFYLLVPMLVRRSTKVLLFLIAVSTFLRWIGSLHGFNFDPWTYRFFPFEIAIFLLGILAYRYSRYMRKFTYPPVIVWGVILSICLITYLTYFIPLTLIEKHVSYLALIFISIPILFSFTSKYSWDRYLGLLSYPLYLSHFLIFTVLQSFSKIYPHLTVITSGFGVTFVSLIVSAAIVFLIDSRIDRLRQARVRNALSQSV